MGINRIRLQNGAMGDPRIDARMQQTYQQNIADNQAQQARNEGIFQAARAAMLSAQPKNLTGATTKLYSGTTSATPFGGSKFFATPDLATAKTYATSSPLRGSPLAGPVTGKILQAEVPTSQAQNLLKKGLTGTREVVLDPQAAKTLFETGKGTLKGAGSLATKAAVAGTKALPFVGGAVSLADAALRAKEGDYIGAGLGAAGAVPVLGLPALGAQVIYDQFIKKDSKEPETTTPTPDANTDRPTMADVAGPSEVERFKKAYDEAVYGMPSEEVNWYGTGRPNYDKMFAQYKNWNMSDPYFSDPEMASKFKSLYGKSSGYGLASGGRVGLAEGTFRPNNENVSTSGLGNLLNVGGLFKKAVDEGVLEPNNNTSVATNTNSNLTARQVAEQNPELNTIREQLFGENYLDDIEQGTGIAQYYSGFGQMPTLDYTPAAAVDTSTPAVDVTQPIVDTGGGGGGGDGDITTPDAGNTDFEQGLIDQGVGVQGAIGDPVVAPGEMLSTQAEMDAYNAPAVLDSTSTAEEIAQDLSNQQAMLNPTGGNIMDEVALTGEITPMDVREQYGTQGQYEGYVNPADVEAGLATESMFDTPEQTKSIGDAFNSVKDLGAAGIDKLKNSLTALGGKLKPGFDNVIEIGGKTIDLGKSLASGALSFATGIPGIGFALDAIKEDPVDTYNQSLFSADDYLNSDMYKADKDMTDQEYSEYKNRLGGYYGDLRAGNLEGQDPFGKNITSAFGDYEAMAQDIVDKVSNIPVNERTQFQKDQLDFYGDVVKDTPAPQEDIGATDTMASINMQEAKDITDRLSDEITDGSDLRGDPYGGGKTGVQSGMNTPTNDFAGQGTGEDGPAGGASNAAANEAAASNREAGRTGQYDSGGGSGSGGGGGGKIVCTMMNESYGFGSFRNKIWLKHSKDLAPEYQIGYHKIFLPLVKLSKTNKVLKKTLEHIAVHRTIDIRQEARGKVHLLGRVYRKILEPICYVVGKYVK